MVLFTLVAPELTGRAQELVARNQDALRQTRFVTFTDQLPIKVPFLPGQTLPDKTIRIETTAPGDAPIHPVEGAEHLLVGLFEAAISTLHAQANGARPSFGALTHADFTPLTGADRPFSAATTAAYRVLIEIENTRHPDRWEPLRHPGYVLVHEGLAHNGTLMHSKRALHRVLAEQAQQPGGPTTLGEQVARARRSDALLTAPAAKPLTTASGFLHATRTITSQGNPSFKSGFLSYDEELGYFRGDPPPVTPANATTYKCPWQAAHQLTSTSQLFEDLVVLVGGGVDAPAYAVDLRT